MKMTRKARVLILALGTFLFVFPVKSQVKDLGNFMAGGIDDASKLFESYLSPYINGFGASLTGGWYNTAKPHKLGGFDLTLTLNTAIVPDQFKSFDVEDLLLQTFSVADGESSISPTIAGERENGPLLQYNIPGIEPQDAFNLVKGTGNPYVPSPMLQVGVGLVKGTEIIGRYMPKIEASSLSMDMWGIGVKHSLKQWIPVLAKLPLLHLSLMGGYTVLNTNTALSVTPDKIGLGGIYYPENWDDDFKDQSMDIILKSFTVNLIASLNLPVVCFYGGVGLAKTSSNLKLLGYYPSVKTESVGNYELERLRDPIDISIKNQDGGVTKPRLNAGIRFKFAVITLHFDYTYANYSVATAGLGLTIR